MRVIYAAVILLFVAAVAVFCVQNFETVSVAYLGWNATLPLPVVVVIAYLFGMITGWGLLSFLRRAMRGATEREE